ncbi:uncharacterized protein BO97DRAFT_419692 [Aspergillus homomorphus CBS 101889]|uniref:Uncharacterized protein n=1 Tax=Aspergillus homomorphus (strain CBS 101889) TaxID=1450537 RepID=A0A395IGX6_ASPHC|nr:hypothetical protein BO97DRAFT_419692 [Aspergillus homomorphus CBS 101889]RAL17454.1 hypothetical protein BO97DRAFT_419692 [Aspergillus homomorphus CBS 101889]
MGLSELPAELILIIAENLNSGAAINSLARTNTSFYDLLNPFLCRYCVRKGMDDIALGHAAKYDHLAVVKRLLSAGADLYNPVFSGKSRWNFGDGPYASHPIALQPNLAPQE